MEEPKKKSKGYVAIDLDGTLAEYHGWKGKANIGDPIESMVEFAKRLIDKGIKVKIFTARISDPKALPYIQKWLKKVGLGDLEVTNIKDQNMMLFYDDRCRQVELNTGRIIRDTKPEVDHKEEPIE
jgi:hypothetical protein